MGDPGLDAVFRIPFGRRGMALAGAEYVAASNLTVRWRFEGD